MSKKKINKKGIKEVNAGKNGHNRYKKNDIGL